MPAARVLEVLPCRRVAVLSPPRRAAAPLCQPPTMRTWFVMPCFYCGRGGGGSADERPISSSSHEGGHSAQASQWAESDPRRNERACSHAQGGAREGRRHRVRAPMPPTRVLGVLPCRRVAVLSPPRRAAAPLCQPPTMRTWFAMPCFYCGRGGAGSAYERPISFSSHGAA